LDDRRRDGGTKSTLRTKEQGTHLTLDEHDDDDDDDDDDSIINLYIRRRQLTARVPSVTRGTIFNGTPSELKYSNYDLIKKIESLIK